MRELLYTLFAIFTAMIDYHMYHDWFWTIMGNEPDNPCNWSKEKGQTINLTIIQETFSFFFK